jgi:hypothetical protein
MVCRQPFLSTVRKYTDSRLRSSGILGSGGWLQVACALFRFMVSGHTDTAKGKSLRGTALHSVITRLYFVHWLYGAAALINVLVPTGC